MVKGLNGCSFLIKNSFQTFHTCSSKLFGPYFNSSIEMFAGFGYLWFFIAFIPSTCVISISSTSSVCPLNWGLLSFRSVSNPPCHSPPPIRFVPYFFPFLSWFLYGSPWFYIFVPLSILSISLHLLFHSAFVSPATVPFISIFLWV